MKVLDASSFREMVLNGFRDIKSKYQHINDLNVFPVPDGDTGTNITSTISGGVKAMEREENENHLGKLALACSAGLLLSASGNSGVIVSQFFQGLAEGLENKETATVRDFAFALSCATRKAYDAVVHPVEGTILTVAREGSDYVAENIDKIKDFDALFRVLLKQMEVSLEHTPDLLDVLKEAGVIDSGGAGLVAIIEGMGKAVRGEEVDDSVEWNGPTNSLSSSGEVPFDENSELEYGYCTEFILQLLNSKQGPEKFDLKAMISFLEGIGDSIVALRQKNIVKVHVHTKTPYKAMEYAQQYGEFVTWKMENMSIQHNEVLLKEMPIEAPEKKAIALIAVAPSVEIADLFTKLGVDVTIPGGQTMNPSAEDFIKAFETVNADAIIVFPNNSNIILTAEQAGKLYDKARVEVAKTKSSVECYSALSMLNTYDNTVEENLAIVEESISNLICAEVSKAVRDSVNNGINVKENDFIGIANHEVRSSDPSMLECIRKLFESIEDFKDRSVLTVFYGTGITEEDKEGLRSMVASMNSWMDLMEIEGNQTIYPFIFAIE